MAPPNMLAMTKGALLAHKAEKDKNATPPNILGMAKGPLLAHTKEKDKSLVAVSSQNSFCIIIAAVIYIYIQILHDPIIAYNLLSIISSLLDSHQTSWQCRRVHL